MLDRGSYFLGQETNEKILYFVRRHWLAVFPWMLGIFVLLVAQGILAYYNYNDIIKYWFTKDEITFIPIANSYFYKGPIAHLTIIILCSYLLFNFALILTVWINYYLDVTFITAQHLVNIEQRTIFIRQVSEQPLARVQDVSSKMKGFFETFFRYGTVFVETAGDAPNFEMKYIPRPHKIANTIMKLHEKAVRQEGSQEQVISAGGDDFSSSSQENANVEIISKTIPPKINNNQLPTPKGELFIDLIKKPVDPKIEELKEGEEVSFRNDN